MADQIKYPYGHRKCANTYEDYCDSMVAYNFAPLDRETWESWQDKKEQSDV